MCVMPVKQLEHLLLCLPITASNSCVLGNPAHLGGDAGGGWPAMNCSLLSSPAEYFSIETLSLINPAFLRGEFGFRTLVLSVSVQDGGSLQRHL